MLTSIEPVTEADGNGRSPVPSIASGSPGFNSEGSRIEETGNTGVGRTVTFTVCVLGSDSSLPDSGNTGLGSLLVASVFFKVGVAGRISPLLSPGTIGNDGIGRLTVASRIVIVGVISPLLNSDKLERGRGSLPVTFGGSKVSKPGFKFTSVGCGGI